MAQKTYFINSDNALYDDEEFAWFQTLLLTAGIVGDPDTGDLNGYLVHENTTPSLAVLVDTGKALLEIQKDSRTFKIVVENLSQETLTIENNDGAAESRVDSIIINLDTSVEPDTSKTNVASIEVVKGDSATALTDSEIDTAVGDQFWYRLADVEVRADTTQILDSDITDQRTKIKFSEAWEREYDPISEQGDLIRGNSSGVSERLPAGNNGEYLQLSGGLPVWASAPVPSYEIFNSSGTFDATGVNLVEVQVVGGGGGGEGGKESYPDDYGAGGGAGGYSKALVDVSSESSITVTVGSGGSGGGSFGGDGSGGGISEFGSALARGGGGGGGGVDGSFIGGVGGNAAYGDINCRGGGGGPGGDGDARNSGASGGNSYFGGGGVGGGRGTGGDGDLGGGGGGGGADSDQGFYGGNGGDGIVIVKVLA